MKPIEEGCKAIIVGGHDPKALGLCVTVGEKVSAGDMYEGLVIHPSPCGITEGWVVFHNYFTFGFSVYSEKWLIRIDDYEFPCGDIVEINVKLGETG